MRPLPAKDTQWIAYSPDGSRVLWSSSRDATTILYDAKTGAPVQTFTGSRRDGSGVSIAPSGNSVYVRGSLFDVKTGREIWNVPPTEPGYNHQVEFATVNGQELLVFGGQKVLRVVHPDTGAVQEADVDCLHESYSWKSTTDSKAAVFARFCSRGVLYTDLVGLQSWTGKKPMPPVRVRFARQMHVTPAGQLVFSVDPEGGVYRTSMPLRTRQTWVQYDPRVGKPKPATAPDEAPDAAGGDFVIARDASRRCEIRPKGAPAVAPREDLGAPASETSSSWLCDAKLSADGTLFFHTGDGALTIGEVPSLKTLFAVGDSRKRIDESMSMTLLVEDDKLIARGSGYHGSTASENELTIERTLPPRKTELTNADDHELASLTEEQRQRVRKQLPVERVDQCSLVGTLTAPQKATLVVCPGSSNLQTYFRFEPDTLTLLPGTQHTGRSYVDPTSAERDAYNAYSPYEQSLGTLGDVTVHTENGARGLYAAQLRDAVSHEILAHLHVGWDFAIATDDNARVQIFGNRKRAVTWLRCLEDDGTVLPFDACSAKAEAKIY